jgi:hypothetical protein
MNQCTNEEIYIGLLEYVKDKAKSKEIAGGKKKLYYISAEFLIGKLLSNNLINLGLYDEVKSELEACGKSLAEIEEIDVVGIAYDYCVADSVKDGLRTLPNVKFNVIKKFCPAIAKDTADEFTKFIENSERVCLVEG